MKPKPLATIIVTPRERFSRARESFASVAANTSSDHRFIYVAGGAPPDVQEYLKEACAQHGYEFISRSQFLSPNAARNLGLAHADTKYLIFLDNDVFVQPGWLDALVDCAEREEADIVSPLVLMGEPADELFHSFGGRLIIEEVANKTRIREHHHSAPITLREAPPHSTRIESDYSEFHCALVRKSVFERMGPFDEGIISAAEHVDLALHVRALGGKGFAEPAAIVTYQPTAFVIGDLATYVKRWSEDWYGTTMNHLISKWNLDPDSLLLSDYRSSFHELRERCLMPLKVPDTGLPTRIGSLNLAQTIVQLLDQMKALGYPDDALLKVQDAYIVAAELFAGSFRASGRTFLAHLIGTGSIMTMFGANPAVIAAAVLHAAYAQGQFPNGFDKSVGMMRRWLRRRVGDAIETLVFLHSQLDFDEVVAFVPRDMDRMPIDLANAILIRIANGIEDRVSGDHHYFNSSTWLQASNALIEKWMQPFKAVADKLGCGELVDVLAQAVEAATPDTSPSPLCPSRPLNYFVDSRTGEMQSLPSRNIREARGAAALRSVGTGPKASRRSISLSKIIADNSGSVVRGQNGVEIQTAAEPWAYSASLDLNGLRMIGAATIEINLRVIRGTLGILVLERGSSLYRLVPELSVDAAQETTTLKINIPAMEEAGSLIFRRWPNGDMPACAVVSAISAISMISTPESYSVLDRGFQIFDLKNKWWVNLLRKIKRRALVLHLPKR